MGWFGVALGQNKGVRQLNVCLPWPPAAHHRLPCPFSRRQTRHSTGSTHRQRGNQDTGRKHLEFLSRSCKPTPRSHLTQPALNWSWLYLNLSCPIPPIHPSIITIIKKSSLPNHPAFPSPPSQPHACTQQPAPQPTGERKREVTQKNKKTPQKMLISLFYSVNSESKETSPSGPHSPFPAARATNDEKERKTQRQNEDE